MAGAGYKLFNTGDVLTAQQVNEYLQQQTVMVFANSTARTTALSGVLAEGMMSYLQDQNKVYVYDGSAWVETGASFPSQTGNAGKYLTTDGTNPSWATVSAGSNWSLLNSGGTALTGAQTVTVSGISAKDKIMILFGGASSATAGSLISIRLNTDTANNYYSFGAIINPNTTYSAATLLQAINGSAQDRIRMGIMGASNTADEVAGFCLISGCNASGVKVFNAGAGVNIISGSNGQYGYITGGYYDSSSTISSISIHSSTGNLDAGTVYVYTSA